MKQAARHWMRGTRTALLALAACAGMSLPADAEIRFGLSVSDNVVYAPVAAAEELGLFAEAGLVVRIVPLRGVGAAEEALAGGHVDVIDHTIAYAGRAIANGADLRIVATATNGFYGWSLIVRQDAPARSVTDLTGKRIGVGARQSIGDLAARRLSDQTSSTFELVPLGPGALVPALRNAEIDGFLFSAAVAQREVVAGNARTLLDMSDAPDRTAIYGYSASAKARDAKSDELRAFMAALHRATQHMQADRDWSVRFIKSFIKVNDTRLAELLHDRVVAKLSPDGESDEDAVARALALAARAWNAPALADLAATRVFSNSYVSRDGM
ncbi:MAG: hypothetical protein JWN93_805 [Hyphomicrobiales bacterium]|nr:hypothetical protein [Hyphomicrobiales bacterium]